jgi:hypothetical protein
MGFGFNLVWFFSSVWFIFNRFCSVEVFWFQAYETETEPRWIFFKYSNQFSQFFFMVRFFQLFFFGFLELISCRFFCSPLVWSILPSQGGWCLVSDTYKMSHLMNLRTLMVKYFFFRENSIIFFRDFENKYTIESQDSSSFIKDSLCIYIPWVSL